MNEIDKKLIEVLTSEYTGVYYVNLKTDEGIPYSMNPEIQSEIGDVFQEGVKYSDAYRMCVENLVQNDDKKRMMMEGTIGNVMKELRNKKTYETIYQDVFGKYCEMKFIKMGEVQDVPEMVALCFSEKDEELRSKEEAGRRLRRNLDIIGILASEYSSVYYIDMNTDELDVYTMNEETESEFGQIFRAGIKYSEAFKMYVNTLVYPNDRENMMKAGSVFNILDELTNKKSYATRYRKLDGRYGEMKFVKVGNEEYPQAVALCFSNKDEEIKGEILLERQQRVFSDLIEDFACVNYVDIQSGAYENTTPYRASEVLKRLIPGWETELHFSNRLKLLCKYTIVEEEREKFLADTTRENILKCLETELAHYVRFHAIVDGERLEYEFKFTADKEKSGKIRGIVAGFHKVGKTGRID